MFSLLTEFNSVYSSNHNSLQSQFKFWLQIIFDVPLNSNSLKLIEFNWFEFSSNLNAFSEFKWFLRFRWIQVWLAYKIQMTNSFFKSKGDLRIQWIVSFKLFKFQIKSFLIFFFFEGLNAIGANVTHMPSGGLRAIQLSNRGEVWAGEKPCNMQ